MQRELTAGWNLISPRSPLSRDEFIAQDIAPICVQGFDQPFISFDSAEEVFTASARMTPGNGYAVYVDEAGTLSLQAPEESFEVSVQEGWNLLGIPVRTTRTQFNQSGIAFDVPSDTAGPFVTITEGGEQYRGTATMQPGTGYWAYVVKEGSFGLIGTPAEAPSHPLTVDVTPVTASPYNVLFSVSIRINDLSGVAGHTIGNVSPLFIDVLVDSVTPRLVQSLHTDEDLLGLEGEIAVQVLETLGGPVVDVLALPITAATLARDLEQLRQEYRDRKAGPKRVRIDLREVIPQRVLTYVFWLESETLVDDWGGSLESPPAYRVHYSYQPASVGTTRDRITVDATEPIPTETF